MEADIIASTLVESRRDVFPLGNNNDNTSGSSCSASTSGKGHSGGADVRRPLADVVAVFAVVVMLPVVVVVVIVVVVVVVVVVTVVVVDDEVVVDVVVVVVVVVVPLQASVSTHCSCSSAVKSFIVASRQAWAI